jgi:uncharacterized protein YqcC (DUF446 family)
MSDTKSNVARELAAQIESEMRRLRLWSTSHPPTVPSTGAFGSPSMTFEEWLQFVFLPNLKPTGSTAVFPKRSSVATAAIRNFDGLEDTDRLLALLQAVDGLINEG